jgi:spore maturation protein CgeB
LTEYIKDKIFQQHNALLIKHLLTQQQVSYILARDLLDSIYGKLFGGIFLFVKDHMIFEKNISKLKETDKELADGIMGIESATGLEVVNTQSNLPSLRVNNISLHSLYDPVKEAKAWACHHGEELNNAASIYVLGFGLGYHVMELCKITDREITVFEARADILRKAFETVDLAPILPRIKIVTNGRVPSHKNKFAVLQHAPSVHLESMYYEGIYTRLKARESINRGLRILVVSPVYGGSHPVSMYCSSSLIKMGHTVELIDNSRFSDALFFAKDISTSAQRYKRLVDLLSSFLSEAVMARCEAFRPDLVLALAQAPLNTDCLEKLRRHKVTTAYWFVEDFRFMDYWRGIAGHYDCFFTIQKDGFFTELERHGIRNYHYLPMSACPDVHQPVQLSDDEKKYYGSDVSFVGAGYYNRRHFLKGLLDFDFKIWGTDWDVRSALARCIQRSGKRIDTDDVVKIFNATKININLHSSTYHKGINPFGDFVNPRTFEIIASGGFQLADRRSGMEGLFNAGEEIVLFDDLNDLRGKITYYLNNPEERERIAERGRQRVLREHTYENRMNEMLEVIAGRGIERPLWAEEGQVVEDLIKESGGDSEPGRYLSRFSGRERITLTEIVREISDSEGDISRTEAIFLMMNEFVR